MTPRTRVVFGGTFDPPHLGHEAVIRGLRAELALQVLVVPNGRPAHRRRPQASAEDRLRMLGLLVRELQDPGVEVCDFEVSRPGPSYTADTLALLRDAHKGDDFLLALGTDAALGLPRWHRPELVLGLARLLIFDRPGEEVLANQALDRLRSLGWRLDGAQALTIQSRPLDASRVRSRLRHGLPCSAYLPPAVLEYIRAHHLYEEVPVPSGADGIIDPR